MPRSTQRGFTLMEIMVVIAIIGIISGIAIPNYLTFARESKLNAITEEMLASLMLAKTEATMRGVDVTITQEPSSWKNGWKVAAGGTNIRVAQAFSGVDNTSGDSPITFKPLLKAGTAKTIMFCTVGATKRNIVIAASGSFKSTRGAVATSCP